MTATLDDHVQAWLTSQGKVGKNLIDYELVDHSDGNGPQIGYWNADKLGPKPTQAQLDSVAPQAELIAEERAQDVYSLTVQDWLDATARHYDYSGIIAACSYVGSSNDLWNRQAIAFTEWRDAVWSAVIDVFEAGGAYPPLDDLPQPAIPES